MNIDEAEKLERDAGRDMPATRKMMRIYRRFVADMAGCLLDDEVITRNGAGELTFGGLRAALAEWEAKP